MKTTATTHTVNIKDVVTNSKAQRFDWNTKELVEIQGYILEIGQKVLYFEAYGARSWWVCTSEPTAGEHRMQNLVEIGGEHRTTTWDVELHDQSVNEVFGIGLYYDNSGERLTAEEIAKHIRASEIQTRWNARQEANQKKAEAQEREELRKQWAGILTPLEDVNDWREREKTEKANVIAYLKNHFPGVKFTARKTSGGYSYCISWTDGPSVSAVESVCQIWHDHTFNGYEDYNEYTPSQFNKLFGGVTYSIDTNRKDSPAAVQAARDLFASIYPAEMVEILDEKAPYGQGSYKLEGADNMEALNAWLHMSEKNMSFYEYGKRTAYDWREVYPREILRRYLEEQDRTQKPQEPTTPTDPANGKANTSEATTSNENAPAEGLELVEIAGGVAVIGDSRTTYKNRREIKAHGAKWNRDAQQWQATTPEAVEQLRQWFGVAQEEQPETVTAAVEASQANESITAGEHQPEGTESATASEKNVFSFAQFDKLKELHPDALLIFRCGDFYELYEQDAQTVAELLGLITTNRPDGVTVCAFPLHALNNYLPRLIRAGYRVAICDQPTDPTPGKKSGEVDIVGESSYYKAAESSPIPANQKTASLFDDRKEVTNPIKAGAGCTTEQAEERIALPAGEYGDLCYDYFGKGSVIVFGNTADHAAQLETLGGKFSERLRYSPLQNGRKWTEKQGRTSGYYFTTDKGKQEAVKYVQRVNHTIFNKYEQTTIGMENVRQKPADFKEGDRVRTVHGLGTVTGHTPRYNADHSVCIKLDKLTYNYGWKGMPQTFIECLCSDITHHKEDTGSEAFSKGDRVKRNGTGATATVEDIIQHDDRWTYIVKYDQTQRRELDGFEFLTEEVFAEEITGDNEPAPFFISGAKYRCIRDVKGKGGWTAFKAGKVYEQTDAPTHWVGWLRNEHGDRHGWPQPVYIPQEVKTWGTKPEDIDPRQFFEPVAA